MKSILQPGHLRLQRRSKRAIHWIDETGSICCRQALTQEDFANGRALHEPEAITCAACCKVLEIQGTKDMFGRERVAPPKPTDWGPLFKPGAP